MQTTAAPLRQIDWWMLATLDRTVCRPCHSKGIIHRLVTDPATLRMRAGRGKVRAAYTRAQKASLRRHIAEIHPELVERVIWSTSPVPRS